MTQELNKTSVTQNNLCKLADDLSHLIIREHQILQDEMQQVRVLVSDAVKNLDNNFRNMNTRASEQASILSDVIKAGCVNEDQQKKLSDISNQINSQAATTIRSLQFDDIVQQLARHTCERIAHMQELFVELEDKVAIIKKLESGDRNSIQDHIKMMNEQIEHFRAKLEKENPVRQSSMDAGKIELF